MTTDAAIKRGAKQLEDAGIPSARLDILLLLELATKRAKSWLLAHPEHTLSDSEADQYKRLLTDRAKRRPMAYIRGYVEFYGLTLTITEDVLIPRPETEILVELVAALTPKHTAVLDVGTGSGAIAVSIASQRNDLAVTATDISEAALDVARRNAVRHHVDITCVQSDILTAATGPYHVIAANLPYLTPEKLTQPEALFEPPAAFLGGGRDGLGLYRQFFAQVTDYLAKDGFVFIEAEPWQHSKLNQMAQHAGLSPFHQEGLVLGFTF